MPDPKSTFCADVSQALTVDQLMQHLRVLKMSGKVKGSTIVFRGMDEASCDSFCPMTFSNGITVLVIG